MLVFGFYGWRHAQSPDSTLHLYYNYSLKVLQGQVPYRDFSLEYPPLALLPFVLPRLLKLGQPLSFARYAWLYVLENGVLSILTSLVLMQVASRLRSRRSARQTLFVYVLLVIVTAPILMDRYDLFPALLTLLALLGILVRRPMLAGIWLGLGIAAKLYPVILLPIFCTYYITSREYRGLIRLLLGTIGATLLTLLPFALSAHGQLLSFLNYHKSRGLQLETLPAGVLSLGHVLGLTPVKVIFDYGAYEVVSPFVGSILKWLAWAFLLAMLAVIAICFSRFRQEQITNGAVSAKSLVVYIVAVVLVFIATGKVFSPQYIIWLLPFAPLLRLRQVGLIVIIFAMTIIIYPFGYNYLRTLQPAAVLLLNLRNSLVVVLLVWLLFERLPASVAIASKQ